MLSYDLNSILYPNANQAKEIFLRDCTRKGRIIDWQSKKIRTNQLSEIYKYIYSLDSSCDFRYWFLDPNKYLRRAEALEHCSSFLVFSLFDDGTKKLTKANFCRIRLCPMCAWRRTLKVFANMTKIMSHIIGYRFILLTLTVKNCSGLDLSSVLDSLFSGWNLFAKFKAFKKSIKGFYRGLEVTYNKLSDTYHPHFHCLLAVTPDYFIGSDYISQSEFCYMWRRAMKLDYNPSVDVRLVKGNTSKAVCEIAKYTVKDTDFIKQGNQAVSAKVVGNLDYALSGRRLVSFGGLFKKIHKELNLQDEIDGDLVDIGFEDTHKMEKILQQTYFWNTGFNNYVLADERFLG